MIDLNAHARGLLAANRYFILGTADPDDHPRTSPVYFTPGDGWEFHSVLTSARRWRHLERT